CLAHELPTLGCSLWSMADTDPLEASSLLTETSLAATSVSTGDFRLGSVISRSASMLWRHFPSFFLVGLMASSPILLLASLQASDPADSEPFNARLQTMFETALDTALLSVFAAFGQAVIIHMAIQDIR